MSLPKDLKNKRFGKLTVKEDAGSNNKGRKLWSCVCDCGSNVIVPTSSLTSGNTKSCGCIPKEKITKRNIKHGKRYSRLYRIHNRMKQRCIDANCDDYKYYGGKGICVCSEWLDFETFEKWALENGYSDDLTIDRIDVDGNYEPINCRWVNLLVQSSNKSNNHFIEWKGEKRTISEWSRLTGISCSLIRYRLSKEMDLDSVFTK